MLSTEVQVPQRECNSCSQLSLWVYYNIPETPDSPNTTLADISQKLNGSAELLEILGI